MAGLLDLFSGGGNDPQSQALTSAAIAAFNMGGRSLTPISMGQVLGGVMQAGQQGYQGAIDRQTQQELLKRKLALEDLQMQGLGLDIKGKQTSMDQAEALRNATISFNQRSRGQQGQNTAQPTEQQPLQYSGGPDGQMQFRSAPSMPQPTGQQASTSQQGQFSKSSPIQAQIQKLNDFADHIEATTGQSGDTWRKQAIELSGKLPKVKDWQQVNVNGNVMYAPYFDDGTFGQPVPMNVAKELQFQNIGGKTIGVDRFTGKQVADYQNTQSPDNAATVAATMRGQNMTDARARESNALNENTPQYMETTNGIVALPKKLGAGQVPVGMPVMGANGQPLEKKKDLPQYVVEGVSGNAKSLQVINNALKSLGTKTGSESVGFKGYLPNAILNRYDPEGTSTRADVADIGSLVLHDRSGAAVTASESPRLMPFIPLATDDAATARKKLERMKQLYEAETNNLTFQFPQAKKLADFASGSKPAATNNIDSLLDKYK